MKYKKIFTLFAAALLFTACGTDNDVDSTSIFDTTAPERNEFDMWLKTNYTDKYNINVIYRYNDKETDNYYNVIPADLDKAKALAILVKHMWLESYEEVAGADFIKKYAPRVYQFIGSAEFNPNSGSIVLGTAEGGLKITLFRVNALDPDHTYINYNNPFRDHYDTPLDLNYWFFHTMHHEFCHILTQTKNYSTDFQTISAADYSSSDWVNYDDTEGDGPAAGFVTGYASGEYNEDFAEIYATYVTLSEEGWQKILEAGKKPLVDENGDPVYKKDNNGRFIYKTDADGNPIPAVDKNGNPIYVTDENGDIVYEKDKDGNYVLATDEEGNPIVMRDKDGNPVKKVDDFGNPVYDVDFQTGQVYYVYEYEKVPMVEYQKEQDYDTTSYDKMVAKFNIVKEYFLNSWGIDIEKMRDTVVRRSTEMIDLKTLK